MQPDKHRFPARKQNPESNGMSLFILVSSSSLMLQSTTPLASPKDSRRGTPGISSTGAVEHISGVSRIAFCLLELGVAPALPLVRLVEGGDHADENQLVTGDKSAFSTSLMAENVARQPSCRGRQGARPPAATRDAKKSVRDWRQDLLQGLARGRTGIQPSTFVQTGVQMHRADVPDCSSQA